MLFPGVVGDDQAEVGFARIKNVSGGALAQGDAVVWDITAPDGVRVSKPATATLSLFVGVLLAALANGGYGPVQCYGYCASAKVSNDTSQAIAAGDILIPVNGQTYLNRSAASDGKSGFIYAAEAFATATTPAAALKKVFIRGV